MHAQIAARTKLFSGAGYEFAAPVNSRVQLLDAAFPGTLPVRGRLKVQPAERWGLDFASFTGLLMWDAEVCGVLAGWGWVVGI